MLRILRRIVGKQKFKNKAVLLRAETIEFNCAMDYARLIVQDTSNKKEQIVLLEFMLNVVRADLKVDILSTIFYSEENFERVIGFPFPNEYYDEMGTELKLHPKGETAIKTSVDLANECVLVLSWDRKSMKHGILNVYKYGFTFDKRDHIAEYYSYVNICYVYNGNHSIASGIVQKKGVLQANKYDVSKLFEHVHTDGVFWYNSHNNQKLGNVFDFRVSIIYEIAKLKHQIEQGE